MIKPGDIVYKKRSRGLLTEHLPKSKQIVKDSIGLVIKRIKERNEVPQYYVQFDKEHAKWYYQHDLHKIGGERK